MRWYLGRSFGRGGWHGGVVGSTRGGGGSGGGLIILGLLIWLMVRACSQ